MIYPPLNELTKKATSRYSLVIATAKRARQIADGDEVYTKCESKKPVTIAINEIADDKINIQE